jgi:septum site-determining protein MinC
MAPVASRAGSSPLAPFELKSASLSVVALVLRTADVAALATAMDAQFGGSPEFFSHDPVVIDLSQLDAEAAGPDFDALVELLERYRMLPVAARGGTEARMAAALAAGLGEAPPAEAPAAAAVPAPVAAASAVAPEPPPVLAPAAPAYVPTLVIHKPLRSGQQVYAKNGDLIVMAAVNFGAEVLADGNIHVYGPLRGKAVAGVKGNTEARIFTTCMEPELVSIAGTYRTTDHPLPANVVGKPAQIRLDAGRLVFEPLT